MNIHNNDADLSNVASLFFKLNLFSETIFILILVSLLYQHSRVDVFKCRLIDQRYFYYTFMTILFQ
jgi:hypothetical protein